MNNYQILEDNINLLRKSSVVKEIWCIPQICNFEDEIVYSTDIKRIVDFVPSKSNSDFKKDFLHIKKLHEKLLQHGFDINLIWSREDRNIKVFEKNNGYKIKRRRGKDKAMKL